MNTYELVLVLPEKATPAKKKSVAETLETTVKVFKGKVVKSDDWGKVELAYPIMGNDNGNFLFFELELESASAKQLQAKLRLEEGVIRHLLIKADKKTKEKK